MGFLFLKYVFKYFLSHKNLTFVLKQFQIRSINIHYVFIHYVIYFKSSSILAAILKYVLPPGKSWRRRQDRATSRILPSQSVRWKAGDLSSASCARFTDVRCVGAVGKWQQCILTL